MGFIYFFSNEHTSKGSNLFIQLLVQGWNLLQKQAGAEREPRFWFRGEMELQRPFIHCDTGGGPVQLPPIQRNLIWVFNFFFRKLFLYHSWNLFVRTEIILITCVYFPLVHYFCCSLMKRVWSASHLVIGRFTFWFSVTHNAARKQLMGVIKTPHWNNFCLFGFL